MCPMYALWFELIGIGTDKLSDKSTSKFASLNMCTICINVLNHFCETGF